MDNYLDIRYLQKNTQKIHYFGLGFIQLILNNKQRLHFYNTNLPPIINEGIHNHRYNFKSIILKGSLIEELYQIINSDNNDYLLYNESCSKDRILTNDVNINVSIKSLGIIEQTNTYYRFFNEFHRVEFNKNTITLLERSDIITDYAQVIKHKSLNKICPFSKIIDDKILWNIVEETIKN